ncbi:MULTISPECIES: quinone-dependent dihydroorotate dehydrogenase [unclassified Moraxella]|uniref:quinone-dependent dihydroorotate dehydrogenase n=1 Tax=unclassified Moraxella TaxID=2685852 RepID=UPI003AF8D276
MYALLRPFLLHTDPEKAHELTLSMLEKSQKMGVLGLVYGKQELPTECMGLNFSNPVGLAAGLDKNGEYIDALSALGFGFIEIGTITPKPQDGNPKPRLFRIKEANAIINRMGFNNKGVDYLIQQVKRSKYQGILGINIGKNAVTPVENALDDYVYCLERVYPYASYITVNISSPNTKNLRDLQSGEALTRLLDGIKNRHTQLATQHQYYVPLVLKVAPDLDEEQIDYIAKELVRFDIDGLITTNTTLSRQGVEDYATSQEAGGLSGRPLSHMSTQVLAQFAERLPPSVALVGVGGIDNGQRAVNKIEAGASLVQIYSGLIYEGPALIHQCVEAIDGYRFSQTHPSA